MQEGEVFVWGGFINSWEKKRRERERYTQLNAEAQRIAKRDKNVFLNEQCKDIKENNRMGKTRDLFKKMEISREDFMLDFLMTRMATKVWSLT